MHSEAEYSFEAIFDIDETRSLFKEFLTREKNEEPLLFIEQAELYSLKKSNLARFEVASKIVKDFIAKGCEHEINVSGEMKEKTMSVFEKSGDSECPATLFQEVQNQILLELKSDCFPRFVRSQIFEQFIAQKKGKDERFVSKIQKKRKNGQRQFDSLMESLKDPLLYQSTPYGSNISINTGSLSSRQQPLDNEAIPSIVIEATEFGITVDSGDDSFSDASSITSQHVNHFLQSDLHSNSDSVSDISLVSSSPSHDLSETTIIQAMSKPYTGITLKDHKLSLFKSYSNCFSGTEMINWVQNNYKITRDEAVKYCNRIFASGQVELANNRKKANALREVIDSGSQLYKLAIKKTVAIVGAGFAGLYLYQLIRKQFDVTLFDEKASFEYNLDNRLLVGDPSQFSQLVIPYKKMIPQAKIVQQKVQSVSSQGVYLDNEKYLEDTLLPFDYTIVCTGSSARAHFPIDEDSQPCCVNPYQSKAILEKFEVLRQAKTICVIGGGPVGIEIAGELCSTYKNTQIVIISQENTFLDRLCPKAQKVVANALDKFPNLKQLTSRRVIEIKNRTLYFKHMNDKGEEQATVEQLKADAFILCMGTTPRTQVLQKHFPYALNEKGFVRVNEKFQVACAAYQKGVYHRNIFAIGDICDIKEEKLAQTARVHAQKLAKNLKLIDRSEDEKKMATYAPEARTQLISVGRSTTVMVVGDKIVGDSSSSVKLKSLVRAKVMQEIKG